MICSQCGTSISENYKFCPTCGAELPQEKESPHVSVSEDPASTQTIRKRKMPLWFKIITTLAVIALIGVTAGILFTEKLVDVIENQLKVLHRKDIESAYHTYTSKEFQKYTSPEEFREFVDTYPILTNNLSAHFTQRSIEHNIGTIKGNLTSPTHVKVPIEYKLIKEQGKWKILSIKFLKPEMLETNESTVSQELNQTVKMLLEGIKSGEIATLYDTIFSKEFREETTLDAFEDFLKRYPILSHYDILTSSRAVIRKGLGTVSVQLSNEEQVAFVKYYFIKEGDQWKIWSMRILSNGAQTQASDVKNLPTTPGTVPAQMTFTDIILGTKLDGGGNVTNPSTIFRADSGEIYVNVRIHHGVEGESVHLNFQHLDSHSSILAKAPIEESGDSMIVSAFSPPIGGWPKGEYQLIVSSSKFTKTINFSIE